MTNEEINKFQTQINAFGIKVATEQGEIEENNDEWEQDDELSTRHETLENVLDAIEALNNALNDL